MPDLSDFPDFSDACHYVPDLLARGLSVVFCGTALGRASALRRAYYANPGNQFWPALARVGFTPAQLAPEAYPRLLDYGIGLTDLCKNEYGNDADLSAQAFDADALETKIHQYQPRWLGFTSKNAAAAYLGCGVGDIAYGEQSARIGATRLYALPSPSGQARRWWREEVWQDFRQRVVAD